MTLFEQLTLRMGGTQSVAIPGGGTEGYHVLRVSLGVVTTWGLTVGLKIEIHEIHQNLRNPMCIIN